MRIFCELRSIFPSPAGAGKYPSNEQNVLSYYMLNHRIRGLLFHYKKNCYFAIGFYSFGNNIQKHPDSVCENDVNNEQNVRGYYMSNHWTRGWLFYCKKKLLFWLLFSGKSIQNILILSVRVTLTTRKPVKCSLFDWIKRNGKMTGD